MDAVLDNQQPRLPLDSVVNLNLRELVECCLCHGLLWYPIACANCEKAFCSFCIHTLNATKLQPICPHGCTSYIERSCPRSISQILSTLNIFCRYKSNGCVNSIPYDKLENHEIECDYQLLTCIGCRQGILKKNYQEHQNQCQLILITCDQCSTSFERKDTYLHTATECLRIQLQQQISKIKQLEEQQSEQRTKFQLMEEKLKTYENFWMEFVQTTNQIKSMFDEQDESTEISDVSLI